ncbi:hypothetical protein [Desulfonema magnum]|uniref:DUF2281 domain-containing protein n=1 Tax=Desulfonema magnum TaxID=45655 RepID=A0A975BQS5_9BACT|nr:hypothetical protein [Desulfonema magnum]QTA89673.1 Uncharacterized protein dnm_057300 [Desulfonema magnum]
MELAEIKNDIQNTIGKLSPDKLKIALEFLKELHETEEEETRLPLSTPGFVEDYREAKEDMKTGKTITAEDK